MGKVDTVFFDFGDTLAYSLLPPLEMWVKVGAEHGKLLRRDSLRRALSSADQEFLPKVYEFRGRMEEFWGAYDRFVLEKLGVRDTGGHLSRAVERYFLETKKWARPFPDTHSTLSALIQKGLALGIISNNTDEVLDRLNDLDLLKYFETVTYSQEAGAEKPAPEPFRLALKRAKRKPEQCFHVGNSYEQDVAGARGVGIRPVLVDREGKHTEADCLKVQSLGELLSLV